MKLISVVAAGLMIIGLADAVMAQEAISESSDDVTAEAVTKPMKPGVTRERVKDWKLLCRTTEQLASDGSGASSEQTETASEEPVREVELVTSCHIFARFTVGDAENQKAGEQGTEALSADELAALPVPKLKPLLDDAGLVIEPAAEADQVDQDAATEAADEADEVEAATEETADPKDDQTVVLVSVLKKPADKRPVAIVSLPLGIYLIPGMTVKVDQQRALRVALETCNPTGCHGGFALSPALLRGFKRGVDAVIFFQDGQQKTLQLPISLLGFTAAYDAMIERNQP